MFDHFSYIKDVRPKIFPRSDVFKLSLQLDNDQLMSEKQNNWGVTVLVSEIKPIGNAVFLEALVM